jgi:fibronectin-binding autotransporter adhesin
VFARDKITGALTQLAGTAGCVSDDGTGGLCANGTVLADVKSVTVSHDGRNVYVASVTGNAVVIFARDPKTGALIELDSQAGCVSENGSGGLCADGKALEFPFAIAVSRDGKNVYVASQTSKSVAVFARAK